MALKPILKPTNSQRNYRGVLERHFCEKAGCSCVCCTWEGCSSLVHAQAPLVTAGAVLSCLEQSNCHRPAPSADCTNKPTNQPTNGLVPTTPGNFFDELPSVENNLSQLSHFLFGRKHCLSDEMCQGTLFSWRFCWGWKMPSLKEPAHWYPGQETGMYKERSFTPGVHCKAQTTES